VHVGVLSAAVGRAGQTLAVPVWYSYQRAERLAMARHYLGAADGNRYVADNPDSGREKVAFRMRPERWL
jgi:hypothetical protein